MKGMLCFKSALTCHRAQAISQQPEKGMCMCVSVCVCEKSKEFLSPNHKVLAFYCAMVFKAQESH
jgi:hypothetical protein